MKVDGFIARYGLVQWKPTLGRKYPRDGLCEVCDRAPRFGKLYLLFDHCHEHGWTRGLVCHMCNDQLGFLENGQTSRRAFQAQHLPRLEEHRHNCPECPVVGYSKEQQTRGKR